MKWMIVILTLAAAANACAGEKNSLKYNLEAYRLKQEFSGISLNLEQNEAKQGALMSGRKKPPLKAMFFSVIIPGAGELYTRSYLQAAFFFGLEVLFIYNRNANDDKTDDYFAFGDEHWLVNKYYEWLRMLYGGEIDLNGNGIYGEFEDYRLYEDFNGFTHNLPPAKNDSYYDMIGKYLTQFGPGWDDCIDPMADTQQTPEPYDATWYWAGGSTANAAKYRKLWLDAQDAEDMVRVFTGVIVLNHIASAIDAGITAWIKNKRIETSMNVYPEVYCCEYVPMGQIKISW